MTVTRSQFAPLINKANQIARYAEGLSDDNPTKEQLFREAVALLAEGGELQRQFNEMHGINHD